MLHTYAMGVSILSPVECLDRHIPECMRNPPQRVIYPNPEDEDECTLKFRAHYIQVRLPFYLVCDFESFLFPVGDDDDENLEFSRGVRPIDEHRVCGFACHRVTSISKYQTDPVVYSGRAVMSKFYDHVMSESKIISDVLHNNETMIPMTPEQQRDYDSATHCTDCHTEFTSANWKVRQ